LKSKSNSRCRVLDTFDDFLRYWKAAAGENMQRQIELWETSYMSKYPELLQKQLHDYASMGMSWRKLAGEKVFPNLRNYLPVMEEARENLLEVVPATFRKACEALGIDLDVIFVIYVGIGCGAGWVTRYRSTPAVLLGLENIAELGWSSRDSLEAVVAHELGHLAHMAWRNEWDSFAQAEKDPLFQLYSEGFAQRCEHIIQGADTWHRYQSIRPGWQVSISGGAAKVCLLTSSSDPGWTSRGKGTQDTSWATSLSAGSSGIAR